MARRKIEITPSGIQIARDLPTLEEVANSVSEADYRDAIANPADVLAHWNKFKTERGGGSGLSMINDIDPSSPSTNTKIAKNAFHPSPLVRGTLQMGMALAQADSSGVIETCGKCRTPQCTAICNGSSGKMAIKGGTAEQAKQIRTQYWAEHPQYAGALAVIQSRQGAAAARSVGMIAALRTNMWQDANWAKTNLRKPWIEDMEEKAGSRGEGVAADFPLLTHMNYTKETANQVLRPGQHEPEVGLPSNYKLTLSISEQTPTERVRQREASGGTSHAVVYAKPTQEKPDTWTMEDKSGDRETFKSFNADNMDAIMHNASIGNVGVGLLRQKQTRGLEALKGTMGRSSMVRPLDPDAPVGSPTGVPLAYASPELLESNPPIPKRGSRRGAAGF